MKPLDVKQGSEEWYKLRCLMLTASYAQQIAANGAGLKTYVMELLKDYYSTADRENFSNRHTERGNELEESAAFVYSMQTGRKTEKSGFVVMDGYDEMVGCSPDYYVDDDGLIEIKCPDDKGYFDVLVNEKIDSKYLWQMQMQLLVTGRKWNDYVVYNPNFSKDLFIKRVEPDEESFEKLKKGFESGVKMLKEIRERMDKILKVK